MVQLPRKGLTIWPIGEQALPSSYLHICSYSLAIRILAAWYLLGQNDTSFPSPGAGIQNLSFPHELIDARSPDADPVLLEGAAAGHVLVKNVNNALPLQNPKMLSIFGYDAQAPPTKNIDKLFELGYQSQPEMADAVLGFEAHFSQRAYDGVIFAGGRSGSNGPSYIDSVSLPQSVFLVLVRQGPY